MTEDEGVIGERGVQFVKQWLEATTYFDIPNTAYDLTKLTTLELLQPGSTKKYDLTGRFRGPAKTPVACEVKTTSSEGGQGTEYPVFLANSYAASYREHLANVDTKRHYMWITHHPFQLNRWPTLTTVQYVRDAIARKSDIVPEASLEEDYLREFCQRLWLLVVNARQQEITLTTDELYRVNGILKRDQVQETK